MAQGAHNPFADHAAFDSFTLGTASSSNDAPRPSNHRNNGGNEGGQLAIANRPHVPNNQGLLLSRSFQTYTCDRTGNRGSCPRNPGFMHSAPSVYRRIMAPTHVQSPRATTIRVVPTTSREERASKARIKGRTSVGHPLRQPTP